MIKKGGSKLTNVDSFVVVLLYHVVLVLLFFLPDVDLRRDGLVIREADVAIPVQSQLQERHVEPVKKIGFFFFQLFKTKFGES